MVEYVKLGEIDISLLQKEFGDLLTDEIIITNERVEHIKSHHSEDYKFFGQYLSEAVNNPDMIIKDCKNKDTVFIIKKLEYTNLNVVIKLVLANDDNKLKNSVMTFFRIREKNVIKLERKNKLLYKKE